jgi:hypothetical protein
MTRAGLSAWGALRRPLRKHGEGHVSSDSEAENEQMNAYSWTKAGGPLFRSSSQKVLSDHGDEQGEEEGGKSAATSSLVALSVVIMAPSVCG